MATPTLMDPKEIEIDLPRYCEAIKLDGTIERKA